ncbi:MAG TPA: type II 3-dehydroquinate dehydratase [Oscillospiraceae bacterium]|nr:type II 3-dehydroquinate dehydratase [Oscillospiraceae bacterium]
MQIIIINGPNLNMLGTREPEIYGKNTYDDLCRFLSRSAKELGVNISIFQSNHEGAIVDCIQESLSVYDGIIINPAAYTHTSVAILDALKAVGLPAVEVHISDIDKREDFRKTSFISLYCEKCFSGYGFEGYKMALSYLKNK